MKLIIAGCALIISAASFAGIVIGGSGSASSVHTQTSGGLDTDGDGVFEPLPGISGGVDASSLSSSFGSALAALGGSLTNSGGIVSGTIGSFGSPAPTTVSYVSTDTSACTVSGSTVTAVALGTCSITATISNDGYYNGTTLTETFEVTAVNQEAITLNSISWSGDGTASFPGVTGGSGSGAVTYSASSGCSISGTTITASAPGTCSVTANKAASGVFDTASVTETVTIPAMTQDPIAFDLSGTSFSGTTATLPSATGGSGSGSFSYAVASGPCTLNGSTLTATGIGTCSVTATKTGSGLYSNVSVTESIVIADTDGDGVSDIQELADGTDPNVDQTVMDSDGDGTSDHSEILAGTNPNINEQAIGLFASPPFTVDCITTIGVCNVSGVAPTNAQSITVRGQAGVTGTATQVASINNGQFTASFTGLDRSTVWSLTADAMASGQTTVSSSVVEIQALTPQPSLPTLDGTTVAWSGSFVTSTDLSSYTSPWQGSGAVIWSTSTPQLCTVDPNTGVVTRVLGAAGFCAVTATRQQGFIYLGASHTFQIPVGWYLNFYDGPKTYGTATLANQTGDRYAMGMRYGFDLSGGQNRADPTMFRNEIGASNLAIDSVSDPQGLTYADGRRIVIRANASDTGGYLLVGFGAMDTYPIGTVLLHMRPITSSSLTTSTVFPAYSTAPGTMYNLNLSALDPTTPTN